MLNYNNQLQSSPALYNKLKNKTFVDLTFWYGQLRKLSNPTDTFKITPTLDVHFDTAAVRCLELYADPVNYIRAQFKDEQAVPSVSYICGNKAILNYQAEINPTKSDLHKLFSIQYDILQTFKNLDRDTISIILDSTIDLVPIFRLFVGMYHNLTNQLITIRSHAQIQAFRHPYWGEFLLELLSEQPTVFNKLDLLLTTTTPIEEILCQE